MPDDAILVTEKLTKEFHGFVAVSGVDLKVRRGTIHALIGPNGAGKTTVFNLLTRFLPCTKGRILFNGHGDAGMQGGPAGDAYIVLHVKDHPIFEREGNDLHCAVPVSFAQAALGAEIRIPTLEGEATLKVPEGTQTGTTFRLRHKGMPILNASGRGDLYPVPMK